MHIKNNNFYLIFLSIIIVFAISSCKSKELKIVSNTDEQTVFDSRLGQFAESEDLKEVFNNSQDSIQIISNDIGIDCSKATMISEYKTAKDSFIHACKLSLKNDDISLKIRESGFWKDCSTVKLSKETNVSALFQSSSSLLSSSLPSDLRPAKYFKNGYYIFINHNALLMNLTNKFDEFALESDYHNFTFAFFDVDNNNLYYYKYNDTAHVLNTVGAELGVNLSDSVIIKQNQTYWSSYSYKYPKITYYEFALAQTSAVKKNSKWKNFPVSGKASDLLTSNGVNMITYDIPDITKGQYYYADLLDDTYNHNENICSVVAVFDEASNKIYYYKFQYYQSNK